MSITKVSEFGRIQILDEREPDCGCHNLNMLLTLDVKLMDDGEQTSELLPCRISINPQSDLATTYTETNKLLQGINCSDIPNSMEQRVSGIRDVDNTTLVQTRFRVSAGKEAVRQFTKKVQRDPELQESLENAQTTLVSAQSDLNDLESPCPTETHLETRMSLITVLPDGRLSVRLRKCVCEAGEIVSPAQYHRFVLEPGKDRSAQMGVVDKHLPTLDDRFGGFPELPQSAMDRIERIGVVEHTPAAAAALVAAGVL